MIFLKKDGKYFKHFNKYWPQLVVQEKVVTTVIFNFG